MRKKYEVRVVGDNSNAMQAAATTGRASDVNAGLV